MHSSPGSDEDQGTAEPTVVCDCRERARCVPDGAVNRGYWQSLTGTFIYLLTCARAGPGVPVHELLSSGSLVSFMTPRCRRPTLSTGSGEKSAATMTQPKTGTAARAGDHEDGRAGS
jgi:hypothetical protein